jgi:hypothetical protein
MTREEKIRIAKAEYHRRWRKKNPQKAKLVEDNFWLKKYDEFKGCGPKDA